MKRRVALVVLLTPVLTAPAFAGIFFNKKPDKPNPTDRVPELIKIVQTDGDEDKRIAAAEELRDYDPAQFPDVTPALIDVLMTDKKPGVRAEAVQSLGKIRPVSDQVGVALEQALAKDSSMRVRLQARSVLLQYRWSGWKEPAPKKDDMPTARPKGAPTKESNEPPLAPTLPPTPKGAPVATTPPPPAPVPIAPPVHEAQPLPQGPPAPPLPGGDGGGPVLNPPPG
jgi:HEAT repeats